MRKRITFSLAVVIGALALPLPALAQSERPDALPVDAVTGLLQAFDDHRLVAVGEEHGDVALHRVLRRLIRDPRFPRKARLIVVEFASAFHQRTLDRYVRGEPVAERDLQAVWRDAVGGGALGTWDAPIYRRFLATVRAVNRGLPAGRRIRVLAGDPPIDWAKITSNEQVERYNRDRHFATVVERYVMRRHRSALLVAGSQHFERHENAPVRNVSSYIDARHPGAMLVVIQPPTENIEPFVRDWATPSFALIDGTTLGLVRPDVPPGLPFVPPTLEERADALLYITRFGALARFSTFYPSSWRDSTWNEMWRRLRLGSEPIRERDLFLSQCLYADFQGRGLDQWNREEGREGEPVPAGGALSLSEPTPEPGVASVLTAFDSYPAVFLGIVPSLDQEHRWIRSLLVAPDFAAKVRNVVVPFGNARYQGTLDAYLNGRSVPRRSLVRIWRDTTQLIAWDGQVHARFFARVRRLNQSLPQGQRIRIWLGEPPFNWSDVRGYGDIARILAAEPGFMARLVNRLLARGERVLVITPRSLATKTPGSVRTLVERVHPNASFSVVPHVGFAAGQRDLEARMQDWPSGSLVRLSGTWLGALLAGRNDAGEAWYRWLADVADAYLYFGPRSSLSVTAPFPSTYRDAYWSALRGRHRLIFGEPLRQRQAFPTSNCRQPAALVGPSEPSEAE